MSTEIVLPKVGFSMNEAELREWLAADGAEVKQGDPLYAFESDKSVQEIESPASGRLRIVKEPGQTYQVGEILGFID